MSSREISEKSMLRSVGGWGEGGGCDIDQSGGVTSFFEIREDEMQNIFLLDN